VINGRDAVKAVPDEVLGGRTATGVLLCKGHWRVGFASSSLFGLR
jgi:hypothetical protein